MEITLLSNIPHYHYLAQAMEKAGWLKRYITSVAMPEHGGIPAWLPEFWRKKLEGRRMPGVPISKVSRICAPEAMQRLLPKLGWMSGERADYLNNHMFDLLAMRWITSCGFFHFVSSVGLYSARRARALGATIVCDVRQEHPYFQKRVLQAEYEKLGLPLSIAGHSFESKVLAEFQIADYFIVPSGYARDTFVAEGYPRERIFVAPYGVDLRHFHITPKEDSRFRVLFAGQITIRKGIFDLLEAFGALRIPGAELLLIGSIDPAIVHLLKPYRHLFRHLPPVPKTELHRYYSNSSVMVLPSLADAFPLVVAEAMACGLPVIISENTGTAEAVTDGREGFVVPVHDRATLGERIERLYKNPELRSEMGLRAQDRARQMTWAAYGARALDAYRTIESRRLERAAAVSLGC